MLTVKELINILIDIPNKDLLVVYNCTGEVCNELIDEVFTVDRAKPIIVQDSRGVEYKFDSVVILSGE